MRPVYRKIDISLSPNSDFSVMRLCAGGAFLAQARTGIELLFTFHVLGKLYLKNAFAHGKTIVLALACGWLEPVYASCFAEAAQHYSLPESMLRAIAQVESGNRPQPPSSNADGSYDIGIMRINSRWLPLLQRHGIARESLDDPCQNIYVGAWILASNRQRLGPSWEAVGAYNVGCRRLDAAECARRRNRYSWKVYCAMTVGTAPQCTRSERLR